VNLKFFFYTNQTCKFVDIRVLQEVYDYLKSLCPDLHVTRGEYDEDPRYPETKTLTIGQFKLGLCHGHQVRPFKLGALPSDDLCVLFIAYVSFW
jgi:predicted phosphodiesterase